MNRLQEMSLTVVARIGVGMVVMMALTAMAAQAQTATACRYKGALWVKNTSGKTVQDGWEKPAQAYPPGHEAMMEDICVSDKILPPVKKDLAVTLRAPEPKPGGEWRRQDVTFYIEPAYLQTALILSPTTRQAVDAQAHAMWRDSLGLVLPVTGYSGSRTSS